MRTRKRTEGGTARIVFAAVAAALLIGCAVGVALYLAPEPTAVEAEVERVLGDGP